MRSRASRRNPIAGGVGPHAQPPTYSRTEVAAFSIAPGRNGAMFETGVRQFRLALGMTQGRRLDPRNVARLVDDVLATLAEFGEPGADVAGLIGGPVGNPAARLAGAHRSLRRTACRLAAQSPFYARRFSSAHADPAKLDVAGLRAIP